jgi:hypothetical protein
MTHIYPKILNVGEAAPELSKQELPRQRLACMLDEYA